MACALELALECGLELKCGLTDDAATMALTMVLVAGLLFGLGLIISDMTDLANAIGFFDSASRTSRWR
jgi:hypothetical protein